MSGVINTPGPLGALVPLAVKRTRTIPFVGGWNGVCRSFVNATTPRVDVSRDTFDPPAYRGIQVTVSENHPEWRNRKELPFGDKGGEFSSSKTYAFAGKATYNLTGNTNAFPIGSSATYVGGMLPGNLPSTNVFPASIKSSDSLLDVWGTKAIALCKPTNHVAGLAQAVIELYHEGLPKMFGAQLWKDRIRDARKGGSEYLNLEFGFKPLANDIADFAYGVIYLDRLLKQYERDSGRVVRRRFSFPPIISESFSQYGPDASAFIAPGSSWLFRLSESGKGKTTLHTRVEIRRWFSGAFTYHLPQTQQSLLASAHASTAQRLLGADITPETLWQLTPWSWAVDWFTNTGDVISNLVSWQQDGLVMRYGYIMEHSKTTLRYIHSGPTGYYDGGNAPQILTIVREDKVRRRATPFGFGLLMSGLSTRQKAIAAALGLTRVS